MFSNGDDFAHTHTTPPSPGTFGMSGHISVVLGRGCYSTSCAEAGLGQSLVQGPAPTAKTSSDQHARSAGSDLLDFQTKEEAIGTSAAHVPGGFPPQLPVRKRGCLPGPSSWTLSCHLLVKTFYIQSHKHFKREPQLQFLLCSLNWTRALTALETTEAKHRDILVLLHLFLARFHFSLFPSRPFETCVPWLCTASKGPGSACDRGCLCSHVPVRVNDHPW